MVFSKSLKRFAKWGSASVAALTLAVPGAASAASISTTGPGSVNIITASRGSLGNSGIFLTGPGSVNVIRSNNSNKSHFVDFHNNKIRTIDNRCDMKWEWNKRSNCDWNWWNSICNNQNIKQSSWSGNWSNSWNDSWQHNNVKHDNFNFDNHRNNIVQRSVIQRNDTDVNTRSNISQNASSGSVNVSHNTEVGDIHSGSVSNEASNETTVNTSNNSGFSNWSDSWNSGRKNSRISFSNNTDVNVSNNINQTAKSGNVNVFGNTVVGNVSSGSASNWASNMVDVSAH